MLVIWIEYMRICLEYGVCTNHVPHHGLRLDFYTKNGQKFKTLPRMSNTVYILWLAGAGLSSVGPSSNISIAYRTFLYPGSAMVENLDIPPWSTWMVWRFSWASPIIADSPDTTWTTRMSDQVPLLWCRWIYLPYPRRRQLLHKRPDCKCAPS